MLGKQEVIKVTFNNVVRIGPFLSACSFRSLYTIKNFL